MHPDVTKLNETVWAKLGPSKIHGIGVIAIRNIKAGTHITDYGMYETKTEYYIYESDFIKIHKEIRKLILDRMMFPNHTKTFHFRSPNCEAELRAFMNHSDNANSTGYIALRDIKAGEEITENYHIMLHHCTPHPFQKVHMKAIFNH